MIKILVGAGSFAALGLANAAVVAGTADITYVVGSGANRSNLVIDFHDGSSVESYAWGFRYDGLVSGADMVIAIAAADPNLSLTYSGSGTSGFFLSQIDYTTSSIFHSEAGTATEYWAYYVAGGTAGDDTAGAGGNPTPVTGGGNSLPGTWTSAPTGASAESFGETGRLLTDGSWDAWSFGEFSSSPFVPPGPPGVPTAAVPEPSTALLGILGALGLLVRRR